MFVASRIIKINLSIGSVSDAFNNASIIAEGEVWVLNSFEIIFGKSFLVNVFE
jgi:hypothetical protein